MFKPRFISLVAVLVASCSTGFLPVAADAMPKLSTLRGTPAGMNGPNLMADSSFESMETRVVKLEAPFRVAADPHAHNGKADVQATLSRSGKRMYSHVSVWKNTDYRSSIWVRGSGSGTFFVSTADLTRRLAGTMVAAAARWREVSLSWNSGGQTRVAIGFQDDAGTEGAIYLDDFYTGLEDGRTIAFVAPPASAPKPHAPPGFTLVFDDEFNDLSSVDINNTQQDGYKWYVKGMWFPSTSRSMYEILPCYQGASGVLAIKDAPVSMSWNFSTTLFDDAAPQGYRGTVFLPDKEFITKPELPAPTWRISARTVGPVFGPGQCRLRRDPGT